MNASNNVLLESSGLSVERDGLILRDVDWTVREGEHWVIRVRMDPARAPY